MIYFFTPYSFEKRLFEAYDTYMNLVQNPDDWVCFLDGDTAFLISDFGHKLKEYTERYPDTGAFTCMASRCHYEFQSVPLADQMNTDILHHKNIADNLLEAHGYEAVQVNRRIAGHLIMMRKRTWLQIREGVKSRTYDKKILGIDTKISYAILNAGMKIMLMKGFYILHYLRLKEGYDYKNHLE
jgi:GT2 family glycosyltransferase